MANCMILFVLWGRAPHKPHSWQLSTDFEWEYFSTTQLSLLLYENTIYVITIRRPKTEIWFCRISFILWFLLVSFSYRFSQNSLPHYPPFPCLFVFLPLSYVPSHFKTFKVKPRLLGPLVGLGAMVVIQSQFPQVKESPLYHQELKANMEEAFYHIFHHLFFSSFSIFNPKLISWILNFSHESAINSSSLWLCMCLHVCSFHISKQSHVVYLCVEQIKSDFLPFIFACFVTLWYIT